MNSTCDEIESQLKGDRATRSADSLGSAVGSRGEATGGDRRCDAFRGGAGDSPFASGGRVSPADYQVGKVDPDEIVFTSQPATDG